MATLDATKFEGILSVNCDSVDSPNIRYPTTALPAHIKVQIIKLHNVSGLDYNKYSDKFKYTYKMYPPH